MRVPIVSALRRFGATPLLHGHRSAGIPLPPGQAIAALSLVMIATPFWARAANAQVIERHVPEIVGSAKGAGIDTYQPPVALAGDNSPVGVTLRRILVIEGEGSLASESDQAIQLPVTPGIRQDALTQELASYLGQPLSQLRISEIVSRVVEHLRKSGYPVVAVTVPEQDISAGMLALRLFSFRMGRVTITGAGEAEAGHIRRALRQKPGEPIAIPSLAEDVDALNENPFRTVAGSFVKGDAVGTTDLVLDVEARRPWNASLGMVDVGAREGRGDRYYASVQTGGWIAGDLVLGYQLTASRDFWMAGGQPFGTARPEYLSHSIAAHVPLVPRHQIEMTVSRMTSQRAVGPFLVRSGTIEMVLGYRGALSDFLPLRGDLRLGLEVRRQERRVLFDAVSVTHARADIVQVYLGWRRGFRDATGLTQFDLTLHASPGGLGGANSARALGEIGNSDPIPARYAYATLSVERKQRLGTWGELRSGLDGQLTQARLPVTEQASIGGAGGVRAYGQDTGAFDQALVLTNRLYAGSIRMWAGQRWSGQIQPYLSADLGWALDNAEQRSVWASSLGVGASIKLGPLSLDAGFACTLHRAGAYAPGECRAGIKGGLSL